jgi:hypothetical protein
MSVGKIAEKVKATVADAKAKVKGAQEATKDKVASSSTSIGSKKKYLAEIALLNSGS